VKAGGGAAMNYEEKIIERYKARIGNRQLFAVRAHCVECFGGQPQAVADCPSHSCALWPWRMGKGNPNELEWKEARGHLGEVRGTWTAETQSIAPETHIPAVRQTVESTA
jgi:hypothetical protein